MTPLDLFNKYRGRLLSRKDRSEPCKHNHMAIGIRKDGAIVQAYNNTAIDRRIWESHAEARLVRKMDVGGVVYVMRLGKLDGFAMSMPCPKCTECMIRRGIKTVYFTTGYDTYSRISL